MKRMLATLLVLAVVVPFTLAASNGAFSGAVVHYDAVRVLLVQDKVDGVAPHAAALGKLDVPADVKSAAAKLAAAKSLTDARAAFGPLSDAMIAWRDRSSGARPAVAYCPMAKKSWLQPAGEIGNPYYGASMARCGEIVRN